MNPTSKFTLPAVLDPVVAAVMEQLAEQVEAKDRAISAKDRVIAQKTQALAAAEAIIQQLKEALRMERIKKYGKQSEKLSDLQLELLDLEPAVSSDEIESEVASGPLSDGRQEEQNASSAAEQQQKKRKPHPGRNELPAHLERDRRDRRLRGRAVHLRQVRCRDPRDWLRRDRGARHEARGALRARDQAREARLRALRHRGCGDRASAGPHRAQIDLRRRNHHRIHHPEILRCASTLSPARDSDARSRHRCGADHDQRCRAARGRVADSRSSTR